MISFDAALLSIILLRISTGYWLKMYPFITTDKVVQTISRTFIWTGKDNPKY